MKKSLLIAVAAVLATSAYAEDKAQDISYFPFSDIPVGYKHSIP